MARVLIIDDDPIFRTQLTSYMTEMGHSAWTADTLADARKQASETDFEIIFLDVMLPEGSGLDAIRTLKILRSSPEIIIVTGKGEPDGAETALKNGAWHYIEKPPHFQDIKLHVTRALSYRERKISYHEKKLFNRDNIIGNDYLLKNCLEATARASDINGNVLITGETGTGKELFARAIHINGNRKDKPFITVDCTNITPALASSLLFGHRKGTYTGAHQDRDGLVKQADGGILFLDEIGDLPLETQKTLLRVLQNKTFRPLGSNTEYPCDFRVIAATNKDLPTAVRSGEFREDLYYRLTSVRIELPPLRERTDDIELLARHYVSEICNAQGIDIKGISREFLDILKSYSFPGNIRELINILQTSISNSIYESAIYPHSLPLEIRITLVKQNIGNHHRIPEDKTPDTDAPPASSTSQAFPEFKIYRDQMEADYLKKLLQITHGKIPEACTISGISRARLYELLGKHRLQKENTGKQPL